MKIIALIFSIVFSIASFSQLTSTYNYKYDIFLASHESFIKIPPSQWYDSINLNQQDKHSQYQSFEISLLNKNKMSTTTFNKECDKISKSIDSFMKDCKSIESIISTYGHTDFDLLVGTYEDNIRHISGFYYSIDVSVDADGSHLILNILYPRYDMKL